jgi:hypothetical protein
MLPEIEVHVILPSLIVTGFVPSTAPAPESKRASPITHNPNLLELEFTSKVVLSPGQVNDPSVTWNTAFAQLPICIPQPFSSTTSND